MKDPIPTKPKPCAILEKYRGYDNKLIATRETFLNVEELKEAIRAIWEARSESYDFRGEIISTPKDCELNGQFYYRALVWESVALQNAGADPVYRFVIRPIGLQTL